MKIILGSSSKPRKEILEKMGYKFEVMSPDIDEKAVRTDDYYKLSHLVARAKTEALLAKISEPVLLITADQVVVCNGNLFEKPQTDEEAKMFLETYSKGFPAETVSAVIVTNTKTKKTFESVDVAKVFFNPIPSKIMDEYVKSKIPFSHAGGIKCESELLRPYIQKIEGTIDSVAGLPIKVLEELLVKAR